MNFKLKKTFIAVILLIAIIPTSVFAAINKKTINVTFNKTNVKFNGVNFNGNKMVYNKKIYLPIKGIAKALDMSICYYEPTKTMYIGPIAAGEIPNNGVKNLKKIKLDNAPIIKAKTSKIQCIFNNNKVQICGEKIKTDNISYNGEIFISIEEVCKLLEIHYEYYSKNSTAYVVTVSDEDFLNETGEKKKLHSVPASGEMKGWQKLIGHEYESIVEIYYKNVKGNLYVRTRDIRKVNLNKIVAWTDDNGNVIYNKLGDLYKIFSKFSEYTSEWLYEKFGDIYLDWGMSNCINADKVVIDYLKQSGQIKVESNITLTPDAEIEVKTGLVKYDGVTVFNAYDKKGSFLGTYTDGDDTNLIVARLEKRKELPPKLSDGWVSTELLSKIYDFDIKIENDNIIFQTHPFVTEYKEFLRLKVSDGWITNDNESTKVNGVKLKKYITKDSVFKEEWIDKNTLDKEFGVYCGIGDTINDFKLYAPYDENYQRKVLFKGKWPSKWQDNSNQNEVNINGVSVKRKDNIDYFKVEDLKKFNITPEPKKTNVIYFNIQDLQKIGLIK